MTDKYTEIQDLDKLISAHESILNNKHIVRKTDRYYWSGCRKSYLKIIKRIQTLQVEVNDNMKDIAKLSERCLGLALNE